MTNYNDGKWHGWNGGECPVHHETVVEVAMYNSSGLHVEDADGFNWRNDVEYLAKVIAFRVIKEHKEPREFWLINGYQHTTRESAETYAKTFGYEFTEIIHVREVLE